LRRPLTPEDCRRRVVEGLRSRETTFVSTVESKVYRNPRSPYRALLELAGIELGDIVHFVRSEGVEASLGRLADEGVTVTLEEFKGNRPIERPGLRLDVCAEDFDDPDPGAAFPGRTGGSRGRGRRLLVDLEHLTRDAAYHWVFDEALDAARRPLALWRPVPPGSAGLYLALSFAKAGRTIERWFSQNRLSPLPYFKEYVATAYTLHAGRRSRRPLPRPEHVPVNDAALVAEWLAAKRRTGSPARLNTTGSCGVRVALAAIERGLDISGSLLVLGGEPLTPAKVDVVSEAGARAVCSYYLTEAGRLGITCAAPADLDDVHVVSDKVGVIQRERSGGPDRASVPALLLTVLQPSSPKVMLNVDSGDYGVLEERDCGCPVGELGLRTHIRGIRSYEKVASEGMSFLGSELLALVEQILPARFGGSPIDYQLVEEEVAGLPCVSVLVSPGVGAVDEADVVATTLRTLAAGPGHRRMMAAVWEEARTLRVLREEPVVTDSGKVLPLHVLDGRR
jgi:hypothetical protein